MNLLRRIAALCVKHEWAFELTLQFDLDGRPRGWVCRIGEYQGSADAADPAEAVADACFNAHKAILKVAGVDVRDWRCGDESPLKE